MKTLLPYFLRNSWGYMLLIFLMIGQALTSALQPRFLGQAIDALNTRQVVQANTQVLLFLGLSIASMTLAMLVTHLAARQAWTTVNQIRHDQLRWLLLSQHQHQTPDHANLMETLDTDPNRLVQVFGTQLPSVIMQVATVVFLCAQLIAQVTLPGLLYTGLTLTLLTSFLIRPERLSQAWTAVRQGEAQARAATVDVLTLGPTLRTLGTPRPAAALLDRVRGVRQTLTASHIRAITLNNLKFVLSDVLLLTGTLLILLLLLAMYRQQAVTIGVIVMFLRSIIQMRDPVAIIAGESAVLLEVQASLQRITAHFAVPASPHTAPDPLPATTPGHVEIKGLHYAVEGRPLLRGVHLTATPGQHVLITGPSGSGKTTLGRLIDGTLRPERGAVLLGGHRADTLNPWNRRECLWVASQQQPLIHGTLRENLRLYDPRVSDEQIRSALADAQQQDWADSLGTELDTVLSPGRISAGQAQIITLLCALIAARPVTLLDEPSAHLTLSDQAVVNRIIGALKRRSTVLHITHTPDDQVDVDQRIDLGATAQRDTTQRQEATL